MWETKGNLNQKKTRQEKENKSKTKKYLINGFVNFILKNRSANSTSRVVSN